MKRFCRSAIGLGILISSSAVAQSFLNGDWAHKVETDPLDDTTSCHVLITGARLPFPWVFYHSKEGVSVSVIGDEYPDEAQSFRVDKLPAITGREGLSGKAALNQISQIRAGGQTLLVKFIEWPSGAPVVLEMSLNGIVEHLDACKKATRS